MKKLPMLLCVAVLFLCMSGAAQASLQYQLDPQVLPDDPLVPYTFTNIADGYGYELQISPNLKSEWEWHVPIFTLTNTSTNSWADITSFAFTIGDTDYNFDHLGVGGRDTCGAFSADLNNDGSYGYCTPDNIDACVRSDIIMFSEFTGFDTGDCFKFISDIDIHGAPYPGSVENFRTIFWNNDLPGNLVPNSAITVSFSAIPEPATIFLIGLGALIFRKKQR